MAVLCLKYDLGEILNKKGFQNITFPKGDYAFVVELDDLKESRGDNALLQQECANRCKKSIESVIPPLVKELQKVDLLEDASKRKAQIDKVMDGKVDALSGYLVNETYDVFKVAIADRSKYRKTNVKSGVKITVAFGGAIASATLAGVTAASGVGLAVGIVGMVRSTASGVQECVKLGQDATQVAARLATNLAKLKNQVKAGAKAANSAKEAGKVVMNNILATEIETLVVTVEGVEGDMTLLKQKLRGVKTKMIEKSKPISGIVAEQQKLADKIAELEKRVKDVPRRAPLLNPKIAKLKAAEDQTAGHLDKLLIKVSDTMGKVQTFEDQLAKAHKDVAALKSEYNTTAVKVASVATKFLISAGSFAAGGINNPDQLLKDLTKGVESAADIAGLVLDMASTSADLAQQINEGLSGD